jgi:MFS transporter, UMF1 family
MRDKDEPGGMMTRQAYPPASARIAWGFFDWATQPVFTLIVTFVFGPYFVILYTKGSGLEGQAASEAATALWGFAMGAAGLVIAIGAPILGAIADESGRRKPWTIGFALLSACGAFALWWASPMLGYGVAIGVIGAVVAVAGAEFATLFNNAMMPGLAPPEKIGRLSGMGWALGYASALVGLGLMLVFLLPGSREALPALTMAGLDPLALFGIDATAYEGERLVGPLTAIWFLIFLAPMLLFTPDMPKGKAFRIAVREGFSGFAANLRALRQTPDLAKFLAANMLYQDGLGAVFSFGAIFGAAMFGWSPTEAGIFGIVIILAGIAGALAGGMLDDRFGARNVIATSILLMLIALLGIFSIGQESILFGMAASGVTPNDGLLAAGTERFYLACGVLVGLVAGPMQAASRSMLVRLSPVETVGKNFGLFTLAGKATAFLGPTLVGIAVSFGHGVQLGALPIALLFLAGLALLLMIRKS